MASCERRECFCCPEDSVYIADEKHIPAVEAHASYAPADCDSACGRQLGRQGRQAAHLHSVGVHQEDVADCHDTLVYLHARAPLGVANLTHR